MPHSTFSLYAENAISAYAAENIESGRWPKDGALERSRADFNELLPQGLATPNQHLFIMQSGNETVGYLHLAVVEKQGFSQAFVYDVEVLATHQRQGHAKRAFAALEPIVRALGLSQIGLHVFAQNEAARALYRSLGYQVTSINMLKKLGA
jgi:ribosomal protein S18 acetylase RimI-like enzyme